MWDAYRVYPEMQDAEMEHDGTIEVAFGSRPATLTLHQIDNEAVSLFSYGHCGLLAYAIHLKTGFPFAVFTSSKDENSWQGHVGLLVGENQILDITGVNTSQEIARTYHQLDGSFDVLDVDTAVTFLFSEEYRENPLSFVGELEQLVLDDFADFVISENKNHIKLRSLPAKV